MTSWLGWLRPSVARRLVVAQLLTLALTWFGAVAYFAYQVANDDSAYWPDLIKARTENIVRLAEKLWDQPEALAAALNSIDLVQRHEGGGNDEPVGRTSMAVWVAEQLVFDTPGDPPPMRAQSLNNLERRLEAGRIWRVYTHESSDGRVRVTLTRSADVGLVVYTLASNGLLVLPLLIAMPLLWIAAWISVRLALRPWRQLSAEVERRAPGQLAPLEFRARHQELRPLADSIDALLGRVREGISRERSIVADAAHELRTPIAAMQVHIDALGQLEQSEPAQRLLQGLTKSCDRAGRMVAQLLSLNRSEATSAGMSRQIRLDELVQDRMAAIQPIADLYGVELEFICSQRAWINGEPEALASLIDNLTENAIKYGLKGGRVCLSLTARASTVELLVDDQGSGISPHLYSRVFDRFYRVPGQTQSGSGLGLAIALAVAKQHDAGIELDTSPLGGLRVRVEFDLIRSVADTYG